MVHSGPLLSSALRLLTNRESYLPQAEQSLGSPFLSNSTCRSAGRSRRTAKEVSEGTTLRLLEIYIGLPNKPLATLPPWPGLVQSSKDETYLVPVYF